MNGARLKIKVHALRSVSSRVEAPLSTLGYRDLTSNREWRRNLISFTSLLYAPDRGTVLCGLTAFDTDIMYEFDTKTARFRGLKYPSVSEEFEIKIHRSLHRLRDGRVVGATACLHREDQRAEGAGGRIFILDLESGQYDFLGIPVPRDYIQTITVDEDRQLVYGFSYPVLNFFVFDMNARKTRRVDYMGSIPHIVALDERGRYWATWNNRAHNLFYYDPDADRIHFLDHSLPHGTDSCGLMYPGAGPIDSMVNGGDGYLYIGEACGNLDRLDPETGEVEDLGKPVDQTRISALEVHPDGHLYGIAGFLGKCHLFRYDRGSKSFEDLGHMLHHESGEALVIGHDLCFAGDGTVFVGESDTSHRAGWLWECEL
jgi:hypothetical protein